MDCNSFSFVLKFPRNMEQVFLEGRIIPVSCSNMIPTLPVSDENTFNVYGISAGVQSLKMCRCFLLILDIPMVCFYLSKNLISVVTEQVTSEGILIPADCSIMILALLDRSENVFQTYGASSTLQSFKMCKSIQLVSCRLARNLVTSLWNIKGMFPTQRDQIYQFSINWIKGICQPKAFNRIPTKRDEEMECLNFEILNKFSTVTEQVTVEGDLIPANCSSDSLTLCEDKLEAQFYVQQHKPTYLMKSIEVKLFPSTEVRYDLWLYDQFTSQGFRCMRNLRLQEKYEFLVNADIIDLTAKKHITDFERDLIERFEQRLENLEKLAKIKLANKFSDSDSFLEAQFDDGLGNEVLPGCFDYQQNQCLMCKQTGNMDQDIECCLNECEIDVYVDVQELGIPLFTYKYEMDFVDTFLYHHNRFEFYKQLHSWIDVKKLRKYFDDLEGYSDIKKVSPSFNKECKDLGQPCFKTCSTPYDNMVRVDTNYGSKVICTVCDSAFYQEYLKFPVMDDFKKKLDKKHVTWSKSDFLKDSEYVEPRIKTKNLNKKKGSFNRRDRGIRKMKYEEAENYWCVQTLSPKVVSKKVEATMVGCELAGNSVTSITSDCADAQGMFPAQRDQISQFSINCDIGICQPQALNRIPTKRVEEMECSLINNLESLENSHPLNFSDDIQQVSFEGEQSVACSKSTSMLSDSNTEGNSSSVESDGKCFSMHGSSLLKSMEINWLLRSYILKLYKPVYSTSAIQDPREIAFEMIESFGLGDIVLEMIQMSLEGKFEHVNIVRLFRNISIWYWNKKEKMIILNARRVCLGVTNMLSDNRNSARKVYNISHSLWKLDALLNNDLEAQFGIPVNVNLNFGKVADVMEAMQKGIGTFFEGQNITSFRDTLVRFIMMIFECISSSSVASKMRSVISFLSGFDWTTSQIEKFAVVLVQVLKRPFTRKQNELEAQFEGEIRERIKSAFGNMAPQDIDEGRSLLTGMILILAAMLGISSSKVDNSKVSKPIVQRMNEVLNLVKNTHSVWTIAESFFSVGLDGLLESMGLESPENHVGTLNGRVLKWMEEVKSLPPTLDVSINSDFSMAERIVDLKRQGDEHLIMLQKMRVPGNLMTPFMNLYSYVKNYAKHAAPHFYNDEMRKSPLVILLHGRSGTGKSTVMNFAIKELMDKMREKIPESERGPAFNPKRDIFVRNCNQEHWDGYHNQPVVVFDDFMQNKDTEDRTSELNEIIRMKNTTAYPLKMASLEDKGNTRFTSRLVVLSSNLDVKKTTNIIGNSLECPTAIQRRFDVSAEVSIHNQFATNDPDGKLDKYKLPQTENDVDKRFNRRIYGFKAETQYEVKCVNYDGFIDLCLKEWERERSEDQALIDLWPNWTGGEDFEPKNINWDDFSDWQSWQSRTFEDTKKFVPKKKHLRAKEVDQLQAQFITNNDISGWFEYVKCKFYSFVHANSLKPDILLSQRLIRQAMKKCTTIQGTRQYRNHLMICKKYAFDKDDILALQLEIDFCDFLLRNVTDNYEAQFFSVREIHDDELDIINEEEFQLVRYCAVDLNEEKPQDGWRESMKRKFFEFKRNVSSTCDKAKDTVCEFVTRWKSLVNDYYNSFIEKYPWYKIGLGIISVVGFIGTMFCAYSFFSKDEVAEASVSGDQRTSTHQRVYRRFSNGGVEASTSGDMRSLRHSRRFSVIENEASVSGDQRTVQQRRKFVVPEASVSGDQKTLQQRRRFVTTEASVSGDQKTLQQKRKFIAPEAAVSGDQKTARFGKQYRITDYFNNTHVNNRMSAIRKECDKLDTEAAIDRKLFDGKLFDVNNDLEAQRCSDPNAWSLMSNKIYHNLAKISCGGCSVNGLFLCDTILMIPRHMIIMIGPYDVFQVKVRTESQPFLISAEECESYEDDQMDVAFLRLPRRIGARVDITDHFHTMEEWSRTYTDTGVICGWRDIKGGSTMLMIQACNLKSRGYVTYPARVDNEVIETCVLLKGYEYKSQTDKGDCGAPLIAMNTGINRKILGIHVAGSENRGVSNVLTKEYISTWVNKFREVIKPEMQFLNTEPLEAHSALREEDKVEIWGKIDKSLQFRTATDSKIRESPLHGIFPVQTAPALLKPKGDLNPLRIGIEPQFVDQIMFPQWAVDEAVSDMKKYFISYETRYTGRGLLSDHAVLNGIVADKWIRPMNMKTSAGFPYINMKKEANKAGKFEFLVGEETNWSLDEFTQNLVNDREEKARSGVIPMTLFCDALKDEKRPIEKVQEGKTRVFNTAPFDLSIMVRKYFGTFIAHVMDNHVSGECSVGLNPHCDEWTEFYNDLDFFAPNWIAGDFSKYDKTLPFQLIMGACDVINAWYNDEHSFVRKVLFYTMFNACHLTGSTVYRVHQGNPSGIPLTVIINSLVNSIISRVTFALIGDELGFQSDMNTFNKFVKVKNYGDDNIGTVSDQCTWYNMISIKNCLKEYGIKYTPPTKGDVVCEYLDKSEVSYLKRKFVKRGPRVWAPLDMMSIQEMMMWYKTGGPLSPEEACSENFVMAMREMVHYGKKEFDRFQSFVTTEAAKRGLMLSDLRYSVIEKEMTDNFFVYNEEEIMD